MQSRRTPLNAVAHNVPKSAGAALYRLGAMTALAFVAVLTTPSVAGAATWTFTPNLDVRGTYTDNVGLQPTGSERSDTVITTAPGFRLKGDGARLKVDANY